MKKLPCIFWLQNITKNLFRIEELEEALRESVGQTTERDKIIAEQKPLIQQLSAQV